MTEEIAIIQRPHTDLSVSDVKGQVAKIHAIMSDVMQRDTHYGVIPGCGEKPVLLQAGAQKIAMMFRLIPEYTVQTTDLNGGHREYSVKTRLVNVVTGAFMGEGVGSCSTAESKYRFRWENTGALVPKAYWDNRDATLLGGVAFVARKVKGKDGKSQWFIFHKVEHDNPADYFNTALKIATKRSLVNAIVTATAASDIFTQDIDDDPSLFGGEYVQQDTPKEPAAKDHEPPASVYDDPFPAPPLPPLDAAPSSDGQHLNPHALSDKQLDMIFGKFGKPYGISSDSIIHAVIGDIVGRGDVSLSPYKDNCLTKREAIKVIDTLIKEGEKVNALITKHSETTTEQDGLPF